MLSRRVRATPNGRQAQRQAGAGAESVKFTTGVIHPDLFAAAHGQAMSSAGSTAMKDRFDVVVVGVEDKGRVVGWVVFAVKPGCAVVAAAGEEGGGMEGAHRRLIEGDERYVRMVGSARAEGQAKIVATRHTKAEALR